MFDIIKAWFGFRKEPDNLAVDRNGVAVNPEVCIAVVRGLREITCSDSDVAHLEAKAISDIVRSHFLVDENQMIAFLKKAAGEVRANLPINAVYALLNRTYCERQKVLLLAACWRIVLADGQIERAEKKLATQLRYRFQLSEDQEAEAIRIAEEG